MQQADDVGAHRVAKAGVELLGDGGAADHAAALDHLDPEPGGGEVAGAHQAVVASADDHDVVVGVLVHPHHALRANGHDWFISA